MSININGKLRIKGATTGGSGGGTPNYTFKTTAVGETNYAAVNTTTGYIKFNTTVYNLTETGGDVNYTLDNPNGEYTLVSCDEFGTPSGNILGLILEYNQIITFNGAGLSSLVVLDLTNNELTTFNAVGLTSLTNLNLSVNQLTSFNGTGLSSLTTLNLPGNQLTSFNGSGLSNLTILGLNDNQLTSFNGTGLSSLTTLSLANNPLVSFNGGDMSLITSLDLSGVEGAGITTLESIDVSNLTSLNQLLTYGTLLDASDNDSILAQLDENGVENGFLFSTGTPEDPFILLRTSASDADYNSLISKGWAINPAP